MREQPIYPQSFGSGIPNPIGPATWRGLDHVNKIQKIPENWGPLVTKKLQFGTEIALFSQDQFNEIKSTLKDENNDTSSKEALLEKSKQLTQGWTHSKEHQKRQALIKLMKEEAEKKEKIEQLSKAEMELDLQRKKEVIAETEKLLKFSTERYKDVHRGMLLSEVLKERDIAMKLNKEKIKKEKEQDLKQDLIYLERVGQEKEKEKLKKIQKKDFEKEWAFKRDEQCRENKLRKEREFQEEVEEYNRKVEIMHDEIKKERKLQEIEELERKTRMNDQRIDMGEKKDKRKQEQIEDEAAFDKMYSVQDYHEQMKQDHIKLEKARLQRIAERQDKACHSYSELLSKIKDDTEERNLKYNEDVERKLFQENIELENKKSQLKSQTLKNFQEYEKEKHAKKLREREAILLERENHINKVNDVHGEVKKKKEASAAAQKNLINFWSKQKKDIQNKRKFEIDDAKRRLSVTLKGYNEEDDQLEQYVQDLLISERGKDLNVYPIVKAKQSLQLGRGVPLIAADGSKIRLNPKPKDTFYRTQDARDRLSINWNVPDKKPLKVNVNDKSQGTMQACMYKPEMEPL